MSGKLFDIGNPAIKEHQRLYGLSQTKEQREAKRKKAYARKAQISKALSMGHKLCTKCNEELPLSSFQVDKTTFTGYSSWCKSCKKDYNQRYRKNYADNSVEGTNNDNTIG